MKRFIYKYVPEKIIERYLNLKRIVLLKSGTTQDIFTRIYRKNHWNSAESVSGSGSHLEQTALLRQGIEALLVDKKITSMLDIPCGDFNWMNEVNLKGVDYIGADIVEDLIAANRSNFKDKRNVSFEVLDIIRDKLPKCDLIFCRDCLVHLSNKEIHQALSNIKSSGSRFLLTTTFVDRTMNMDTITGHWRTLNLELKPFHLPPPLHLIDEGCTQNKGKFKDKAMGLWEISSL